jgi:hypothetical protein
VAEHTAIVAAAEIVATAEAIVAAAEIVATAEEYAGSGKKADATEEEIAGSNMTITATHIRETIRNERGQEAKSPINHRTAFAVEHLAQIDRSGTIHPRSLASETETETVVANIETTSAAATREDTTATVTVRRDAETDANRMAAERRHPQRGSRSKK